MVERAKQYAQDNGNMTYIECSSKSSHNIKQIFKTMAREIWEDSLRQMEEDSLLKMSQRSMSMMSTDLTLKESININDKRKPKDKNKKCC